MRTKALLLSAAIGAALAPSALAQVYSVNAVGYINLPTIPAGSFAIIANQLDNGAGNMLSDVIPSTANNTIVYAWDEAGQTYITAVYDELGGPTYTGAWTPEANAALIDLSPGKGAFVKAGDADVNLTFVGDVPQGDVSVSYNQSGGFSMVSSMVPQAGSPQELKMVPGDGDVIYQWLLSGQTYKTSTWDALGGPTYIGVWTPTDDVLIGVGEGFWLKGSPTANPPGSWVRNFDINDPAS
jgi:hypothetical protein